MFRERVHRLTVYTLFEGTSPRVASRSPVSARECAAWGYLYDAHMQQLSKFKMLLLEDHFDMVVGVLLAANVIV